MKILVTGGAGYIGSTLVPALLFQGHRVTVLDNFMHGQGASLAHVCANSNLEIVRGDARDERIMCGVRGLVARHDAVIPLAAIVGAPACDTDTRAAVSTNEHAIQTIVDQMSQNQLLLIPITNSGYGSAGGWCTEDSPLRPVSLYGRTKVNAEKIALSREKSISFRLATVFGMSPRMRLDLLVNDFVHRAVTDRFVVLFEAHFKRNYVHVRDVANAFTHAIANFDEMRGRAYNVGLSDANLSKMELCERIRAQVPEFVVLESPIGEDPDKRDYLVSNARIEATGFQTVHSLDDGIRELIKGITMLGGGTYRNA